jgi:hypothetical protein
MEHRRPIVIGVLLVVIALLISLPYGIAEEAKKKPPRGTGEVIAGELATIANQLALKPGTAVDFTHVSGEYCYSAGVGKGGFMTHFTTDPTKTQEDVINFVNAKSLIEAGLDVEKLPRLPGTLGSMTPNQWYYLPAGEHDPHHGRSWSFPMIVKASNIK